MIKEGTIYMLTNRSMPGLIKIGYTTLSISERLQQLNSTGVPLPFEILACFNVKSPKQTEKEIHNIFKEYRISNDREFFEINPKQLFEKIFPIIIRQTTVTGVTGATESPVETLSENLMTILEILCEEHSRNIGKTVYSIQRHFNEGELVIENWLANLKENKLVEERRNRDKYEGNYWRISSKGVKYLFDSGRIDESI